MSYNVGDKFIIEIDSKMTRKGGFLYGIKGYRTLVFDDVGLNRLKQYGADEETLTKAVAVAYKEGEDKSAYRYENLIQRVTDDNAELHEKINSLESENAELKRQNNSLNAYANKLKTQIDVEQAIAIHFYDRMVKPSSIDIKESAND